MRNGKTLVICLDEEQTAWLNYLSKKGWKKSNVVRMLIKECMSRHMTMERPTEVKNLDEFGSELPAVALEETHHTAKIEPARKNAINALLEKRPKEPWYSSLLKGTADRLLHDQDFRKELKQTAKQVMQERVEAMKQNATGLETTAEIRRKLQKMEEDARAAASEQVYFGAQEKLIGLEAAYVAWCIDHDFAPLPDWLTKKKTQYHIDQWKKTHPNGY